MKVLDASKIVEDLVTDLVGVRDDGTPVRDISSLTDIGCLLPNANNVDNWLKKMLDKTITTIVANRPYSGSYDSYQFTESEFGAIVQKLTVIVGDFQKSGTWDIADGSTVDQYKVHKPQVIQTLFSQIDTWELPITITQRQLESAFRNINELNAFTAGIMTDASNSLEIAKEALFHACVSNFILKRHGSNAKVKTVNLLHDYNTATNKPLTVATALYDTDFLRYCALQLALWSSRMATPSTNFNDAGDTALRKHTSGDYQRVLLLDEFSKRINYNMMADVFNKEIVQMPTFGTVNSWLGQDASYSFASCSKVASGTSQADKTELNGVVGIIHDKHALGITTRRERVTTSPFNAKGEYYNYFNKAEIGYFNDLSENSVVFVMQEA